MAISARQRATYLKREWVRSSHPGPPAAAYQWTALFILEGNTRSGGKKDSLLERALLIHSVTAKMLQWKICQCLYCDSGFQALRTITKLWMASSVVVFKTIPLFDSICHFWHPLPPAQSFQMKAGRYQKWNMEPPNEVVSLIFTFWILVGFHVCRVVI